MGNWTVKGSITGKVNDDSL